MDSLQTTRCVALRATVSSLHIAAAPPAPCRLSLLLLLLCAPAASVGHVV
jgi:hypothetical protein